jgi:hypothetical protein
MLKFFTNMSKWKKPLHLLIPLFVCSVGFGQQQTVTGTVYKVFNNSCP